MYQQAQKDNVRPTSLLRDKRKAYTLTADQADASGEVITGIILIHYVPAYILFDFGATYCFILSKFITEYNISCDTVC